jgi:predicted naringenin-chalcone synthase
MDINTVKQNLKQYLALKSELDLLTDRTTELKKRLTSDVEELGKTDDRGHVVLEIDNSRLIKQRKVSKPLDMDVAEKLLREKNIYDKCVKMVPVLQENEILACVYTGELSESDIDTMFPAKVSYAFIVKEI